MKVNEFANVVLAFEVGFEEKKLYCALPIVVYRAKVTSLIGTKAIFAIPLAAGSKEATVAFAPGAFVILKIELEV